MEWRGREMSPGIWRGIPYWCAIGLLVGGLPACSTTQSAGGTAPAITDTSPVEPAEAERPARETGNASKSSEQTSKNGNEMTKSRAAAKEKASEKATAKSDAPTGQPEAAPGGGTDASSGIGVKGLYVAEATFADDVVDRVPKGRFKDVVKHSQVHGRLWFWMRMACEGDCLSLMKSKPGGLPISVIWHPPGAGKGWTNKTRITGDGFRLAFHTANILLGTWKVKVDFEGGAVCTLTRECEFAIEVK